MLWTGTELIVAWTDAGDVSCRRFSAALKPLDDEVALASTAASEGNVILAPFGGSWAAVWR
ncbi:MAG: hypothetical protein ACRETX_10765, partial [Steroidobacteraceae bacterium]